MSRLVRVICDGCFKDCPDDFVHLEVPRFDAEAKRYPVDLCATCAGLAIEDLLTKLTADRSHEHGGEMTPDRRAYRDFYHRWHPRPDPSV